MEKAYCDATGEMTVHNVVQRGLGYKWCTIIYEFMLLYHPVCGLTCSREQQQGFTFGKGEIVSLILGQAGQVRVRFSQFLVHIRAGLCPTEKLWGIKGLSWHQTWWYTEQSCWSFQLSMTGEFWISSLRDCQWLEVYYLPPGTTSSSAPWRDKGGDAAPVTPVPAPAQTGLASQPYSNNATQKLGSELSL